jgi:isocitrate dehydrogenase
MISTGTPVTVAYGDGIGPEIVGATLRVLKDAGAKIAPEVVTVGEAVYLAGHSSGVAPDAWDSLRRTRVLLKGPVTTPQGRGYKSVNVTIRKMLGLYANVRPTAAYAPFVATRHPKMDVVIIRENEEDLYAGIEHRQTDEVMQCLKLITRPGCEKIVRYAFEYARRNGRRTVTCMTKDNIMKLTDGLFHSVFNEVGIEYPELKKDHLIIDIGAARVADTPERFDVIVTPNLYGDILSDIAAQVAGSVGLAPSANIGDACALFEAIHGSAPDIAGRDVANPSGLLLASVMMLVHIGQPTVAERVHNAWLCAIEEGIHTQDIYSEAHSRHLVGTGAFAEAVARRLGHAPQFLKPVRYASGAAAEAPDAAPATAAAAVRPAPAKKEMVGVDVFLHWRDGMPDELATKLRGIHSESMALEMITNRGVKVWPNGLPETFCTDHWRCRFKARPEIGTIRHSDIVSLLAKVTGIGLDFIKSENLCLFDGEPGFAMGQGQ